MLTPQDIRSKEFKKSLHGYDCKAVETYLKELAEQYEKLYQENRVANDRIAMLSDAVRQYKSMEDTLQNALAVAERDGEDVKKHAQHRADGILKDAQTQAAQIITHSAQEVAKVTYQYEQVKRSIEVFRAKVVSLLHAQLDIIKDYSEILVEDEVLKEAKTVFENMLPVTEQKLKRVSPSEQETAELPVPGAQDTKEIPAVTE